MYKQTCHLICIVKNETIPPRYYCACDDPVAESMASNEKRRGLREYPEEYKVENADVVA